jgi:hypothetical protein
VNELSLHQPPHVERARQFVFGPIGLNEAVALNAAWHSRLPQLDKRVAGWRCFAATWGGRRFAVAVWGRPVARLLPQDGSCLELRRFAIGPGAPKNTASRMLGWMARELARLGGARRLVSYQDCDSHLGTIYKAAGWVPIVAPSGGPWNHPGRPRVAARIPRKIRWERNLMPTPTT